MLRHLIVTLLVLGVVIGGYMGYLALSEREIIKNPYSVETLPPQKTYADIQAQNAEQAQADTDTYNTAIERADITLCETIKSRAEQVRCRDMVYATLALREVKKESCDTISDTSLRTRCRDNIVYALASSGTTRSICDELTDETLMSECRAMIDDRLYRARLASGTLDDAFCTTL